LDGKVLRSAQHRLHNDTGAVAESSLYCIILMCGNILGIQLIKCTYRGDYIIQQIFLARPPKPN